MSGDAKVTTPEPPEPPTPDAQPQPETRRREAVTERTVLKDLQRDQLNQFEREITKTGPP